MTHRAEDRSERRPPLMAMHFSLLRSGAVILLAVTMTMLAGLPARAFADEPKPDPSGTATGDKTTAVDAAGNPFVVPEPTDKSAPDYAANKKAFDDYQAQVGERTARRKAGR